MPLFTARSAALCRTARLYENFASRAENKEKYRIYYTTARKVRQFLFPFHENHSALTTNWQPCQTDDCFTAGRPGIYRRGPLTPTRSNGDSLDWQGLSAEEITQRVVSRTKSGSILLFHNGAAHTVEALPNVITILKHKGFRFVKLSELLLDGDYLLDSAGVQHPVATDTDTPEEDRSAPPREAEL